MRFDFGHFMWNLHSLTNCICLYKLILRLSGVYGFLPVTLMLNEFVQPWHCTYLFFWLWVQLESRSTNLSYLDFGLKPPLFGCLTNAIAPPPIALKSISNPQKIRHASRLYAKKNVWLAAAFFVSDVVSEVFLGHFSWCYRLNH